MESFKDKQDREDYTFSIVAVGSVLGAGAVFVIMVIASFFPQFISDIKYLINLF